MCKARFVCGFMCMGFGFFIIKQATRKWIASLLGLFHFTPFKHYLSFSIVIRGAILCCFMLGRNYLVYGACFHHREIFSVEGNYTGRRVLW